MRPFYQYSIPALWAAWLLYWTIAAIGAKPIRRHEEAGARLLHLIPLAVGLVLLVPHHLPVTWLTARVVPSGVIWFWAALALVALGLAFAVAARVWLGGNWSGAVTIKQEHELIRSGPYRWVRHPIYTGLLVALLGSVLAQGELRSLIALALFIMAVHRRIKLEEAFLEQEFGDAYRQYRREVPSLIPLPPHR